MGKCPRPQQYFDACRENWYFAYTLTSKRLNYTPGILYLENCRLEPLTIKKGYNPHMALKKELF